jgi:hypothetical protein
MQMVTKTNELIRTNETREVRHHPNNRMLVVVGCERLVAIDPERLVSIGRTGLESSLSLVDSEMVNEIAPTFSPLDGDLAESEA